MFEQSSLKFLEKLMLCSGPSGFETETARLYRDYLNGFAHRVYTDVMGNTVGILNPEAEFKVMLAGHYDEIGFQVVYISDEGLLYFRANGGIDKLTVPGTEVEVLTANGGIPGVIGKKPIHLTKEKDRNTAVELEDAWIDIGAEDKQEAEALVTIGDPVAVRRNFRFFGKNRIMSKGMDDKIGAFVVAEALRELSRRQLAIGVYTVGTVQEELGLRGATTSAFGINPHVGIAVDVGFSTDLPDINKKMLGEINLGGGPELNRSADNNVVLVDRMLAAAKAHDIPYQLTCGHRASGGTDTATIQLSRSGVATALVSVPNRYMHTPVEVCDLRDAENAVKIIVETVAALQPGDTFIPGLD
ncbi:MAG: M42 family metallopeptidase [Victivallales bacterium]|nr:M42 family metallopeptidase [Victivallales bacterium]